MRALWCLRQLSVSGKKLRAKIRTGVGGSFHNIPIPEKLTGRLRYHRRPMIQCSNSASRALDQLVRTKKTVNF